MNHPTYLWLPFIAAILYSIGALYYKQGFQQGAGLFRTFFINNWFLAAGFVPLAFIDGFDRPWSDIWQPCIVGILFFFGHLFTFLGIRVSDVSLVTPVLGTKTVFVAITSSLYLHKDGLESEMWIAAILTAVAIFILGWSDLKPGQFVSRGVVYTIISAAFFGICDTLVARWAKDFGVFAFSAIMFLVAGFFSFGLIPFFKQPIKAMGKPAIKLICLGAIWTTIQAILMGISIGFFNNPTGVNVVYSSRGLWALLIVWFLGQHFANTEKVRSGKKFFWRILGTMLMTAAIFLAIQASHTSNDKAEQQSDLGNLKISDRPEE